MGVSMDATMFVLPARQIGMHCTAESTAGAPITWKRVQQRELQALRQTCGEALHKQLWRIAPLRFKKHLHMMAQVASST